MLIGSVPVYDPAPMSAYVFVEIEILDPVAYEHYLRGRFFWNHRTRDPREQLTRALGHFERALKEQPDYAEAFVGLADTYNSLAFSGAVPAEGAHASARAAVDRALQIDEELPSAHATRAWMLLNVEKDWDAAHRSFTRALELDPQNALTRFRYAHLLIVRGRLAEAEREVQIARRVDPMSYQIPALLAFIVWYTGAERPALLYMRQAADLEPSEARYRTFAAYVSAVRGDCQSARRELEQLQTASDSFPHMSEAGYALARRRAKPHLAEAFGVPARSELDARLLGGAAGCLVRDQVDGPGGLENSARAGTGEDDPRDQYTEPELERAPL